jgi:hypothetical protein
MTGGLHMPEFRPQSELALLRRIQTRGFRVQSAGEATRLGPWLCFTPMLQAILFGLSTLTGSVPAFVGLALMLAVGLVFGLHPFDWFYNEVVRPIEKSPELPETPVRRRMVFALGIAWCLVSAQAFATGHVLLGSLLGSIMTASTALLAFTHICIPSLVMQWLTVFARRGKA